MNNQIKFTVAICTRNRPQQIHHLLSDLQHQSLIPTQYIFIENIVEKQCLSLKEISTILKHKHVKYLTTTGNKAVAQNICLNTATSKLIIFIDDDTSLKPDTFQKIITASVIYPHAAAYTARTIHTHFKLYSTFLDYWYNYGVLHLNKATPRFLSPTTILCLNLKQLKTHTIKFNEKLYFSEDLDLFCQLQIKHLTLYYLPKVTTIHQFGNRHNLSQFLKRFYQYGFDTYIISKKYPQAINYNWLLPSRKLHYIFFPLFFINNFLHQIKMFIVDNPPFPLFLYPITCLVYLSFNHGFYKSYILLKYKQK